MNESGKIQTDLKINIRIRDKSQNNIKGRKRLKNIKGERKESRYIYVYRRCRLYDNRREKRKKKIEVNHTITNSTI
jgi:hypothetical protein